MPAHEGARAEQVHVLEVDAAADRLDAWLASRLPELSRTRAAQLITSGQVRVNGVVVRKSHRPAPGERIRIVIPASVPSHIRPEPIPLRLVYEDEHLAVVDKPAGMVTHPAPGHATGTLVNALLHSVQGLSGIGGVARPGIVHRLDRDTSGLILVAKHDAAHRGLASALKRRAIRRRYLAACWGHLAEDEIALEAPIGRAPRNRKRMAVVEGGRPARTRFRRLERWVAADLLRADLETGRTHQIRVHLAWLGHPVVGDAVYGKGAERGMSGKVNPWAREFARHVQRQFLHAAHLEFAHPVTGEHMVFDSPLPDDLEAAAAWARAHVRG